MGAPQKHKPFSAEHLKAVTAWLETITGRVDYDPARDELASYLELLMLLASPLSFPGSTVMGTPPFSVT